MNPCPSARPGSLAAVLARRLVMLPLPCLLVAAAAATLPIGEIGVASGKPLRGEPERRKIDAPSLGGSFLAFWAGRGLQRARAKPLGPFSGGSRIKKRSGR